MAGWEGPFRDGAQDAVSTPFRRAGHRVVPTKCCRAGPRAAWASPATVTVLLSPAFLSPRPRGPIPPSHGRAAGGSPQASGSPTPLLPGRGLVSGVPGQPLPRADPADSLPEAGPALHSVAGSLQWSVASMHVSHPRELSSQKTEILSCVHPENNDECKTWIKPQQEITSHPLGWMDIINTKQTENNKCWWGWGEIGTRALLVGM